MSEFILRSSKSTKFWTVTGTMEDVWARFSEPEVCQTVEILEFQPDGSLLTVWTAYEGEVRRAPNEVPVVSFQVHPLDHHTEAASVWFVPQNLNELQGISFPDGRDSLHRIRALLPGNWKTKSFQSSFWDVGDLRGPVEIKFH